MARIEVRCSEEDMLWRDRYPENAYETINRVNKELREFADWMYYQLGRHTSALPKSWSMRDRFTLRLTLAFAKYDDSPRIRSIYENVPVTGALYADVFAEAFCKRYPYIGRCLVKMKLTEVDAPQGEEYVEFEVVQFEGAPKEGVQR